MIMHYFVNAKTFPCAKYTLKLMPNCDVKMTIINSRKTDVSDLLTSHCRRMDVGLRGTALVMSTETESMKAVPWSSPV